jgi:hypothetical protein
MKYCNTQQRMAGISERRLPARRCEAKKRVESDE